MRTPLLADRLRNPANYSLAAPMVSVGQQAGSLKLELEQLRADHGRWPDEEEIETVELNEQDTVWMVYYQPDPPAIVIELHDGGMIRLLP